MVAEKTTSQPASHNWLMDNNEWVRRAGTMWTWRAELGRLGMSSSASCVEYIINPLGLVIPIGVVVRRLLMTCASTVQKWAVLPLSAMAMV